MNILHSCPSRGIVSIHLNPSESYQFWWAGKDAAGLPLRGCDEIEIDGETLYFTRYYYGGHQEHFTAPIPTVEAIPSWESVK